MGGQQSKKNRGSRGSNEAGESGKGVETKEAGEGGASSDTTRSDTGNPPELPASGVSNASAVLHGVSTNAASPNPMAMAGAVDAIERRDRLIRLMDESETEVSDCMFLKMEFNADGTHLNSQILPLLQVRLNQLWSHIPCL